LPSATYLLFAHSRRLAIEAADRHNSTSIARHLQEQCAAGICSKTRTSCNAMEME